MNARKNKKLVAVITIHGMGREDRNYHKGFEEKLRTKLGDRWEQVAFGPVYYQDRLEPNESFVYERMRRAKTRFHSFILWRLLREFLIFFFADPGSLETNKSEEMSAYYQTQAKIVQVLRRIYRKAGQNKSIKLIVVAHSLGCQVISSYIWDAQYSGVTGNLDPARKTRVGVWSEKGNLDTIPEDETEFLKLKSLHRLFTCGCNIPLFTAGHDYIVPFKKPNAAFKWLNFYSRNDVLGWPLQPLQGRRGAKDPAYREHPTYSRLVEDREIRAGKWWQFWNPLAHTSYLTNDRFIDPIVQEIEALISEVEPQIFESYPVPGTPASQPAK
jgi:hypothetical protein